MLPLSAVLPSPVRSYETPKRGDTVVQLTRLSVVPNCRPGTHLPPGAPCAVVEPVAAEFPAAIVRDREFVAPAHLSGQPDRGVGQPVVVQRLRSLRRECVRQEVVRAPAANGPEK